MITLKDLKTDKTKSGYRNVVKSNAKTANGHGGGKPYQAYEAKKGKPEPGTGAWAWNGPRRDTAEEAAQDFCDHMNGLGVALPSPLKTAGHEAKRDSLPSDPEVEHALGVLRDAKAQQEGKQGYVYLIIEEHPGGALKYAKVGYSTNPRARVAELQTGNPRPLSLHYMKEGTREDEAAIHQRHIRSNVLQEWFAITPELLFEWDNEHYVEREEAA